MALALHPSGQTDADLHALLLQAIERLWDARQERLLAAQTTIPDIVWFVVIVGGALTVAFGSFLGAPSLRMQLAMSAVLAASGALVLILIIALNLAGVYLGRSVEKVGWNEHLISLRSGRNAAKCQRRTSDRLKKMTSRRSRS